MHGCLIYKAILLSMLTASISFCISHTQLLERVRNWMNTNSRFFGDLVSCCYCLGHWIAVPLLIIFPVRLFGIFWPADYLLTWLVISWLAGLQSLAASWLWGD